MYNNKNDSHVRDNDLPLITPSIISNPAMFVYIRTGCSKSNAPCKIIMCVYNNNNNND